MGSYVIFKSFKMKIALICPADFTVLLCCKWIIKHIQNKGHEVVVVSPLGKDKFYLHEIKKFNLKSLVPIITQTQTF